jgi:glycosyltransferase involved in cell wall biosynthesis
MRYAWDLQNQYLKEAGLNRGIASVITRWVLHGMRNWDARTGAGVDEFIAISRFVERRIRKVYRRQSTVIYPPVDTDGFTSAEESREQFYLTASRLVPYKRVDLIVEAFAGLPDRQLVVIGDGPQAPKIRSRPTANVRLLGEQPMSVLLDHLRRARAFVFAAIEDFGIAPLEAQACGTPVIALGKGAALETIRGLDSPQPTGVFFAEQTVEALQCAVALFERESARIAPASCRANALRFRAERFRLEFDRFVRERYTQFRQDVGTLGD